LLYCNQQNAPIKIQQNIYDNTHFTLGTNSHMFQNQGDIIREFINSKVAINKFPDDGTCWTYNPLKWFISVLTQHQHTSFVGYMFRFL
jgi:hypothetical protein